MIARSAASVLLDVATVSRALGDSTALVISPALTTAHSTGTVWVACASAGLVGLERIARSPRTALSCALRVVCAGSATAFATQDTLATTAP